MSIEEDGAVSPRHLRLPQGLSVVVLNRVPAGIVESPPDYPLLGIAPK